MTAFHQTYQRIENGSVFLEDIAPHTHENQHRLQTGNKLSKPQLQLLRQLLLVLVCFVRESELNRMERRSDVNELLREERQNRFDLGEKPVRVYVSPRMRCKPEATRPWRIYQPAS